MTMMMTTAIIITNSVGNSKNRGTL